MRVRPQVVVIAGPTGPRRFPIKADARSIAIGSAQGNDVRLEGPGVGPRHCRIFRIEEVWHVEGLDSSQGTELHGEGVTGPTPIDDTDTLKVGPFTLQFLLEPAAEQTAAAQRRATPSAPPAPQPPARTPVRAAAPRTAPAPAAAAAPARGPAPASSRPAPALHPVASCSCGRPLVREGTGLTCRLCGRRYDARMNEIGTVSWARPLWNVLRKPRTVVLTGLTVAGVCAVAVVIYQLAQSPTPSEGSPAVADGAGITVAPVTPQPASRPSSAAPPAPSTPTPPRSPVPPTAAPITGKPLTASTTMLLDIVVETAILRRVNEHKDSADPAEASLHAGDKLTVRIQNQPQEFLVVEDWKGALSRKSLMPQLADRPLGLRIRCVAGGQVGAATLDAGAVVARAAMGWTLLAAAKP